MQSAKLTVTWFACVFVSAGAATGTFIGVGVGVGVFLLLSVLTLVGIILVVVVAVKRKAAYKQKEAANTGHTPFYNNTQMAKQNSEMEEKGVDASSAGNDYDYVDNNGGNGVSVDPCGDVDGKEQIKIAMKQAPKESSTPAAVSVTNIGDLYAVVDKSQKKGAENEKETITNKEDLYAMPMKKKGKLTERGEGVVKSGGMEKGEDNYNLAGVMYEPKADSESVQQIEGDSKAPNVDMLYAVVDKSHKKKQ